jgi:precorrin-6A/cobalt-precorrin-6A reductase
MTRRLLILGGTIEALTLAQLLAADTRLQVITSLAGRTRSVRPPAGQLRRGGFGGVSGLVDYLRTQAIDLVVDATHPFAATMAAHACVACAETGSPRLKIVRPPWQEQPRDHWAHVPDTAAAAALLADRSGCVLLTVGRQELGAFANVAGPRLLARMIEPPEPRPRSIELILGRGPFTVEDELQLLREREVTALVSKNSGGTMTAAKLVAARRLAIPVVMIERPPLPGGEQVQTAEQAAGWVSARLAASGG